jgi:hypothetical protein
MLNHFSGVIRTPVTITNHLWRYGLSTNEMDLKITMSFKEPSQVLAVARILISTYQEVQILTVVNNLSTSPKVIEGLEFHEPHLQED